MEKGQTCFISYAYVDNSFVNQNILPALQELAVDILNIEEAIGPGFSFSDAINEAVRKSDFIISLPNNRSSFADLELQAALQSGKPLIAILIDDNEFQADHPHVNYIRYNKKDFREFQSRLRKAIESMAS